MVSEWTEKTLSDLAILYNDSWKVGDEKCPYIALEHIEEGKLRLNGFGHSGIVASNKYRFNENNFLFGKLRPYFRKVVRPQFSGICSTDIWVVGARSETDLTFLFYLFANQEFVDTAYSGSSGTRMPRADWNFMKDTLWLIPSDIEEQRAIASVLSSLDDKIDLLHRQNQTLEAMTETLFRQWFVEEADEGWEEVFLHDVISVKGGTTPSTKKPEYWDGDIYWTSPRDLSNHTSVFIFDTNRKITERGLAKIGSGLLPIGTVLLSSRAPIGYLAITEIPLAINQGYIAIVCDKMVSNYFIYLWCKANMDGIKNQGNGSVFQEIAKSVFKEISITIPSSPLLDDFDKAVNPIFYKIKTNQQQIRTLEKLRDTLLPKFMSGEVKIEI